MSEWKDYRAESKKGWGTNDASMTLEQINIGAMLRIADATEKMAQEYDRILKDRNWQRERKEMLDRENRVLSRSNAALRGYINRLKKKT